MPSQPRPERSIEVVIERPRKLTGAAIVLAHGAGGSKEDPLLVDLAAALVGRGHAIVRFDFAYRTAGKKLPDKAPVLEATYREAIAAARKKLARARPAAWIIGGKSMGGRMASHLAAQGEPGIDGLLLLGYPLHPAKRTIEEEPKKLRADHLGALRSPTLFVQGTRDPLCDLHRLRPILAPLGPHLRLHVIDEADHSLARPKRAGGTRAAQIAEISALVHDWVESVRRAVTVRADVRT